MSDRLRHVTTTSRVMFDLMKDDLFSQDTQQFIAVIAGKMEKRSHELSREMTEQLIKDEAALTAHADCMRSIASYIAALPGDIERGKKYSNNPAHMRLALERSCYLYAQFQAMEMGLR